MGDFRPFFERRSFVQGALSLCGASILPSCLLKPSLNVSLASPSLLGHRDFSKLKATDSPKILDSVILGGGVSGLAAARELCRQHCSDFLLFELENTVGGNSRSGHYRDKAYPLGAHYLPMPSRHMSELREFLHDVGVVRGFSADGEPRVQEEYILQAPGERLYQWGRWHRSLIPTWGNAEGDKKQFEKFWNLLGAFQESENADEFVLPLRLSPFRLVSDLDSITMDQFLKRHGLTSEPLRWYVDYCCRDDFGTTSRQVSAWAGIHYFLARRNRDTDNVILTWPEGNGFLVNGLLNQIPSDQVLPDSVVVLVEQDEVIKTTVWHRGSDVLVTYRSRSAVIALPTHVRRKLGLATHNVSHAPWVTATLALRDLPDGEDMAWDNVSYHSKSLGYIYNQHQSLDVPTPPYLITYYSALTGDPVVERALAAVQNSQDWARRILHDLHAMHPNLIDLVEDMRVWVWPHAMVKPLPGVFSRPRTLHSESWPILYAHTDDSGMSLFEEAFDHGTTAARFVAKKLRANLSHRQVKH